MFRRPRVVTVSKLLLDLAVLAGAFVLAFVVRFERAVPAHYATQMVICLPAVLLVKALFLKKFGVFRASWRYASLGDVGSIILSLGCATALLVCCRLVSRAPSGLTARLTGAQLPLGVLAIDLPLSVLGIAGLRALRRWSCERAATGAHRGPPARKVPTLLIGLGRTGDIVARELAAGRGRGIRPVGIVTDGPFLPGQVIHTIPVLGPLHDLSRVAAGAGAEQALVCLEDASGAEVRSVMETCHALGIAAKVVPAVRDLVEGRVHVSARRHVSIEDLLRREPVALDAEAIAGVVRDRVVLVTGAGGSIGSELCRCACRFRPAALVLVERAENALFLIHRELAETFPEIPVTPCVADICDGKRVGRVLARHRPDVIFHAAAHKHVPMMEHNTGEAVKNNVLGTRTVADLAHRHGVGTFVMISTDKAVNPTSVMGVSKRIAEMYVQALSGRSRTRFVAVRFGNVLGSNGSVIPIFQEQIARGGPITVTHPEMRRYFMTIPEACQLVLQAASMGRGGEIFILDMGQPIKIVDLARDLIRLSGLGPDDIEITFTGVRPGEKLYEELSFEAESVDRTRHPRIFIGRLQASDWGRVNAQIADLARLADCRDQDRVRAKFKEIVPEYLAGGPPAGKSVDRTSSAGEPVKHRQNGSPLSRAGGS